MLSANGRRNTLPENGWLAGSQCFRPPSFLWAKERWCRDADNESLHASQRRFGISVAFDLRLIDQSK